MHENQATRRQPYNIDLLEELDRLMAQGESMDVEQVQQILDDLQQQAPVMTDYDPQAQWDKLQADYPLLFSEEAPEASAKASRPRLLRSALRVLEVAVILLLALAVAANAAGISPVRAMIHWTGNFFQFVGSPSGAAAFPEDTGRAGSLPDQAPAAAGIAPKAFPGWLPEDDALRREGL